MLCTNTGVLKNQKVNKSAGKCDDKQQYKAMIEAAMIYNTEKFSDISPMSSEQYVPVKQPCARKSLCQFIETLGVKPKTELYRLYDSKLKRKVIRSVSMLWSSIKKLRSHTKINERAERALYKWIIQHLSLCSAFFESSSPSTAAL